MTGHQEAQVIAFTEIRLPGRTINVTARQGATRDEILATVRELLAAVTTVEAAYRPQDAGNGSNGNGNHGHQPQPSPEEEFDALPAHERSAYTPAQAVAAASANGYPPAGQQPQRQAMAPQPPQQASAGPAIQVNDKGRRFVICPIHNHPAYERTDRKTGHTWFSHMIGGTDGEWCKVNV